jgi:hypothetical protein
MRFWQTFGLVLALILAPKGPSAQPLEHFDSEAALREARLAELDWLYHEIGVFASGAQTVLSGRLTLRQSDATSEGLRENEVLAAVSKGAPTTLTLIFPKSGEWVQISQDPANPVETSVTRLNPPRSTPGIVARCTACLPALAELGAGPLLIRLAAQGTRLDIDRSGFQIELSGHLAPVAPDRLDLDRILTLRPGFTSWLRRPKTEFEPGPNGFQRKIDGLLRQPAPAPGGDEARLTCAFETRYTATHNVGRDDLRRVSVADLALGETVLCCVDHASHDGAKICDGAF